MYITEFIGWGVIVCGLTAFVMSLLNKWGIIEWIQVHATNDFIHRLSSCHFCCSWWCGLIIATTFAAVTGEWRLIFLPMVTTNITCRLW